MATDDDDERTRIDREAILARRRRFVAVTLTGLTTSTLATACPCLKVAPSQPDAEEPSDAALDDGDALEDASPERDEIPPEGVADPNEGEAPEAPGS